MAALTARGGILGIEGGGTRTTWVLLEPTRGQTLARGQAGPGNTALLDDPTLERLLRGIRAAAGGGVAAIGGAFAGCLYARDRTRVAQALRRVWPEAATVRVTEDTRSLLVAAFGDGPGIGVIAGTGSNVAGQRSAHGRMEKAVCWGHLFSDHGSAYALARRGLECAFNHYDRCQERSALAREYLAAADLASPETLVQHILQDMSKGALAQWARCVFSAAEKGDPQARRLLDEGALALAQGVASIARRLGFDAPGVALAGGLFENQPAYRARFERALRRTCPGAKAFLLTVPGVIGAARLAGWPRTKARRAAWAAAETTIPQT